MTIKNHWVLDSEIFNEGQDNDVGNVIEPAACSILKAIVIKHNYMHELWTKSYCALTPGVAFPHCGPSSPRCFTMSLSTVSGGLR